MPNLSVLLPRIQKVLFEPSAFFSSLKKEKGIRTAFGYFAILSLFEAILATVVGIYTAPFMYGLMSRMMSISLTPAITGTAEQVSFSIFAYLLSLGLSFVGAAILHLWILLFSGKANYAKTYQLSVYTSTPSFMLGWIPFLGFLTWIYDLILLIIGTSKAHGLSLQKSALIFIVPIAVILLLGLFLMVLMLTLLHSMG